MSGATRGGGLEIGIAFAKSEITVDIGSTQIVGLTVTGTTETPTIEVSPESVATVSMQPSGVQVRGVSQGTATVTAKVGDKTATCTVNVVRPAQQDGVVWAESGISFVKGATEGYSAKFTYTSDDENEKPTVSISDNDRFTVGDVVLGTTEGEASVVITPKTDAQYGASTVTLTIGTSSASIPVEICSPGILIDEATVSPTGVTVSGLSAAFTDGKLYIPTAIYEEGYARYVTVKQIGLGTEPIALAQNAAAITEVHTGNGVQTVAASAFQGMNTIALLEVGSKVELIDDSAFNVSNGSQLAEIVFAQNSRLKRIGGGAFLNAAIEELVLPEGLEEIGGQAFFNCVNLQKATVPSTYKPFSGEEGDIGAFYWCGGLKEVTLPALEFITTSMFVGVPTLEKVTFGGTREQFREMEKTTRESMAAAYVAEAVFKCQNIICTDGKLPIELEADELQSAILNVGDTLTVTVNGKNLDDSITFASSDETIAKVVKDSVDETSATATVTGLGVGNVAVTATCGGVSDTVYITVVATDRDFVSITENITNEHNYYVVGKDDGAQTFHIVYTTANDGTEPTITADGGVVTASALGAVENNNGVKTATFTVTPSAFGKAQVEVAVGAIKETFTIEVCSSGLTINCNADGSAHFVGVTSAFTGGEVHIPDFFVKDGKRYMITQLGVGSTINLGANAITDFYTGDNAILIVQDAFKASNIKTLHLGKNVTYIQDSAFYGSALTAIEFNEAGKLREIGAAAFANFKGTTLVLPVGLEKLGGQAFYGATSLTTLTVPGTITDGNIGMQVDWNADCTNLKTVNMAKMSKLPDGFFSHNAGIVTVNFAGTKAEWKAMLAASDLSNQGNIDDTTVVCNDGTILPIIIDLEYDSGAVEVDETITVTVTGQALEEITFTANPADAVSIVTNVADNGESATATIKGIKEGTVIISITCGNKSEEYILTVVGQEAQLNKIGANVNIEVSDADIGSMEYEYVFTYKPSTDSDAVPAARLDVKDDKACFELGDITTVSVDEHTGLVTAKIVLTVLDWGRDDVIITLEDKSITTRFFTGSAGIQYDLHDQANHNLTVTGVGSGFAGGTLCIPNRIVIDGVDWIPSILGVREQISNTSGKDITGFVDCGGVSIIQPKAFDGMSTLKKAVLGPYVIQVWEYVFRNTGIEELDLSNATRLYTIGAGCFLGCSSLQTLDMSNCCTAANWNYTLEIGGQIVNTGLVTMKLPAKLGKVADLALLQTNSLTTIYMGAVYDTIPNGLFNSANIKDVYFPGTKAQWETLKSNPENATNNGNLFTTATIHCSDGDIENRVFEVNPNHGPTCFDPAYVGQAYEWDFTPLNLFTNTYDTALEYEVILDNEVITARSAESKIKHTFTDEGNITVTIRAYLGADDNEGIETTVTVVVKEA